MTPTPPAPPAPDLPATPREAALGWFVRRRDPGFGAADERDFQAWLGADPAHARAFEAWQQEWQSYDRIPATARQRLWRRLAEDGRPAPAPVPAARPGAAMPRRRLLGPVAAAAGLAALVGIGAFGWQQWQDSPLYVQDVATARGQQAELKLPDGSRLRLDTGTRLQLRYHRNRRELWLQGGQAVFEVQPDAARPFSVRAGPLQVTVTGTRFAVRHTPGLGGELQRLWVGVEEGRVRVEARADADADRGADSAGAAAPSTLHLAAGEQVSADAEGRLSAVTALPTAGFAPWREHRVRFDRLRLDQALAELARYREPAFVIRDPAVASLTLTGVFDPRDLATFRRLLPAALPVRLKDAGGGMTEIAAAH